MPRVTVILNVFNGEEYLQEAMDSIIGQSFSDFELIVIDDHSSDGTAGILEAYTDKRIIRLQNETNLGQSLSINRGLEIARGEYIAKMDADDRSLPARFSEQTAFLDLHSSVGLVGAQVRVIDAGGNILGEWRYPTDPLLIRWALQFYNPLCHPVVMFRRDLVNRLGGYSPTQRLAEDYELWIRMSQKTEIAQLPLMLLEYRLHDRQVTQDRFEEMERMVAAMVRRNINTFWDDRPLPDDLIFAIRQLLGVYPENTRSVSFQAVDLLIRLAKAFCRKNALSRDEVRSIEAQLAMALSVYGSAGTSQLKAYALRQSERLTSSGFMEKYLLKLKRFL